MSIRNAFISVIIGTTIMSLTSLVNAQTSTQPVSQSETSPEAVPTITVEKTQIRVQPLLVTDVPLNEPAAMDFGQLSVLGISPELTRGVTVKAYTRYVEFEGQRIGQVVLTGVEKNGVRELLPANLFNAQFSMSEPRLEPGRDVLVEGDAASLKVALEKLAESEVTVEEETPVEETVKAQNDPGSQQQNSGGGESNDLAGAYQAPESVQMAPEAEEYVNVTVAGCSVRIDIPQMQAYQQNRTETVKDGAVIDQSECSDDLSNSFPLQKSYSVCTENIDLAAKTATAQYELYYTDAGGARQEVTECADDLEKIFPIFEKPEACTIFLDYANELAAPQASLVYQDDSNVEVQVRGCEASTDKPAVAMVQTTDGCTIRHDFTGNLSFQQGAYTYVLDGVQYQAGGCADTETTYAHSKVYESAAGAYVCSAIVDLNGGNATLQSRTEITVNGVSQFVSDCTPDNSSLALIETIEGCESPYTWTHDLSAGQSYGQERFYYTYNGIKNYVSECQQSSAVYAHQVETTGWQNHDDQLFSYSLSTVYIQAPSGRYDVTVSQVLTGATQMPYELIGTETRENGNLTYEACDRFTETSVMELWERPDASIYEKAIGSGASLGPTNACLTTIPYIWNLVSSRVQSLNNCTYQYGTDKNGNPRYRTGWKAYRYGTYQGIYTVIREDNFPVVDETDTQEIITGSYSSCNSQRSTIAEGLTPAAPATQTQPTTTNWNTSRGWN